uniref:Uncharacterized protein n=1 Tax=Rhizophora mucronata TaxID=61149 RepID=A0A2P2LPB9_RHIMU
MEDEITQMNHFPSYLLQKTKNSADFLSLFHHLPSRTQFH